jgi:hypothetical protein
MYGEKPLCGGNFKSGFAEKFKLSETHDKPKSHEWTLKLNGQDIEEYTVESIRRSDSEIPRFWKKGDRTRGSGYIQLPVIYLSLSRLLPIGEDDSIMANNDVELTTEEFKFYKNWHDKILIVADSSITCVDYLSSKQKTTIGVNTRHYDWKMNSAGQDNIGKILLAILSFKRLKDQYKDDYRGGILAIDELDVTLYPGSQIKLIDALNTFAKNYGIQIIFTTHSLSILEHACALQSNIHRSDQVAVIYLEKRDNKVKIIENINFHTIELKLNAVAGKRTMSDKLLTYMEDAEARIFLKGILKRKASKLKIFNMSLSCSKFINLVEEKVPTFIFPDSLIILDGDVKGDSGSMRKIKKLKNILLLPGKKSPECLLADFLYELSDEDEFWEECGFAYSKQVCFRDQKYSDIQADHHVSKKWFNTQKEFWGYGCSKVINAWIKKNQEDVDTFVVEFEDKIKSYKIMS